MKQATKLIHAGEGVDTGATPSLTTPIYETSTFVKGMVRISIGLEDAADLIDDLDQALR